MKISLKESGEMYKWERAFQVLVLEMCFPVWTDIGVPKALIDKPLHVREAARGLFEPREDWNTVQFEVDEDGNILVDENGEVIFRRTLNSDKRVAEYNEAMRMYYLSRLYRCFATILYRYGEECTQELLQWVDRNYFKCKSHIWLFWGYVFFRIFQANNLLSGKIDDEIATRIIEIVNAQYLEMEEKKEILDKKLAIILDAFKNPAERAKYKELIRSDISEEREDEYFWEELADGFSFVRILSQETAFRTWQKINFEIPLEFRRVFFEWGISYNETHGLEAGQAVETDQLDGYCLSV